METMIRLMTEALRPFAEEANKWDDFIDEHQIAGGFRGDIPQGITVGDLRDARRVYNSMGIKS
jgi:hypothetical protein